MNPANTSHGSPRMQRLQRRSLLTLGCILAVAAPASASLVVYGNADEAAWFAAVPQHTTITFAEFPSMTPITDQYADLGVLFTDGMFNLTFGPSPGSWLQDGWGLLGGPLIDLEFAVPMIAIAAHFPGKAVFSLYRDGALVAQSPIMGGGGLDWFGGFTFASGFDRVVVAGDPPTPWDVDPVHLDNLYFKAIPGPGAIVALLTAGLGRGGRRREPRRCA